MGFLSFPEYFEEEKDFLSGLHAFHIIEVGLRIGRRIKIFKSQFGTLKYLFHILAPC